MRIFWTGVFVAGLLLTLLDVFEARREVVEPSGFTASEDGTPWPPPDPQPTPKPTRLR